MNDSEAQLRALISASSDVIYRMSPDWNEMRQLHGRGFLADAAAPTIDWWEEYIFPADRAHIRAVIEAAVRTRGVFELEHRVRRVDGTPGWTFSRAIPVIGADGAIAEWLGTAADVTSRREAEAALLASERKYRSLFDTMGQGYCDLQLLRDADGRAVDQLYLELNPAYERLIGIPAVEAKGRTASAVMPDLEPWWTETFDRIAGRGEPERIEHEVAALGRWFEVYVYPRDRDRLTVLFEDITDRKRAEARLLENERRQSFLLKLSDALRPLTTPDMIQHVATTMVGAHLGIPNANYARIEVEQGATFYEVRGSYAAPGRRSVDGRYPLDGFPGVTDGLTEGQALAVENVAADPRLTPVDKASYAANDIAAFLMVPLVKQGRLLAIFAVHGPRPRTWTEAEAGLLAEVAERVWMAVERARAETALQRSEERLRQFGEASQDVLWIRDAETLQLQYLTPAFEAIYGIGCDEALSGDNYRNWVDLIVPKDRERATEMMRRVGLGEQVTFDYRVRRPTDGQARWLRSTDFPITDEAGRVVLIGGIGHDVTPLRELELRFQTLVEGMPQLVWRAVEGGHWTWASPQWTTFTGQPEADSHGRGWLDRVHPDDREAAVSAWSQAMASGGFQLEYRLCRAAGQYRWFGARATPVRDEAGAIVEWLGTCTDIHDLRLLQERQRILLAELQHRVRNIMAMIRSMARRTAEGSDTVTDYLQHFEGRISAMARTQVLLTRAPGANVDLQNLVLDELDAQAAGRQRFTCEGPDVALSPPRRPRSSPWRCMS